MRSDKETVLDILGQPRTGQNFDRKQSQRELIDIINKKNEEITILHQVKDTRLGYELNILQKKMGIDPQIILKELQKIGDFSVAYHYDLNQLQYLDQLLVAYDETILKQKKIIAMLYSQLQDSEKKAESVIREKEYLLEQNKNKCKKILQIYHRGNPEENLTSAYIKLMRDMQAEKSLLVREESQHIMDAFHNLQTKFQQTDQQLEEERDNANKYYESYKKQSDELKEALISVDNLIKVKDFLEKTVNKVTEENIALQTLKNQMEARIGKLEGQLKNLRSQMFNHKKIGREDLERQSIEVDSMKSELDNAIKRQKETFNKMMLLEKELQNAKQTLRGLKRQNEKLKSDFEQTIKMCDSYQTRVNTLTRREENVREIMDQSKQKLENVLLERDKAILKVQQLQKIMQNMSERHRSELSKQRQNYQKMLSQFQQKMHMISDEKQECESLFMETELGLKNQIQKLKRENSILHEQNLKFVQNIRMSTGSQIIGKLKEYQSKNDSLTKILNQKERALKQLENKQEESVHQYEGETRNLSRLLEKEKGLTTQYMKQLTQERSKVNILTNERECLENQLKRLKKSHDSRNVQINDEREYKIAELESRLGEAVKKEKETRARAIEMLEKYDQAEEKLKGQYEKRIVELQTQNQRVKKKLSKLRQ